MPRDVSRRSFLIRAAGALVAPALLQGCRRKPEPTGVVEDSNEQAALRDLDDVGELATFRPPLPASEPVIRVRVLQPRSATLTPTPTSPWNIAPIRIGTEDQWLELHQPESDGRSLAVAGPLHVTMGADGWSVVDGNDFRAAVSPREALEVSLLDDPADGLIEVQESANAGNSNSNPSQPVIRQYPGVLRLIARHDVNPGGFDLINDVPLERYLPGVLAGELYRHWQFETFAAQAVAARSFACTEIAVFAGRRHYDVTNTTRSQMYVGNTAHQRSRDAVATTRGMVLAYEGLLVSGYYSSCCGGTAASAKDVIGDNPVNNVPPLHGRSGSDVCMDAPVYQWRVEQSVDALSRRLTAFAQERRMNDLLALGTVAMIETVQRNAHGRPTMIRVTDRSGHSADLPAEVFRRAASYSGQGLAPLSKPLRSSNIEVTISGSTAIFDGKGFGHGVGLCQYGAEALAKSGMMHHDILQWYYPDAELVRAYA